MQLTSFDFEDFDLGPYVGSISEYSDERIGTYIDYDRFRDEQFVEIAQALGIAAIPWGQKVSFSDIDDYRSQIQEIDWDEVIHRSKLVNVSDVTTVIADFSNDLSKNLTAGPTLAYMGDIVETEAFLLPDLNAVKDIITDTFDELGVPSGSPEETEGGVPREYTYFSNPADYNPDYIAAFDEANELKAALLDMKKQLDQTTDVMMQKMILFAMFSYNEYYYESYLKIAFVNYWNRVTEKTADLPADIQKDLNAKKAEDLDSFHTSNDRQVMYSRLKGIEKNRSRREPYRAIRNNLAHKMRLVEIVDGKIMPLDQQQSELRIEVVANEIMRFFKGTNELMLQEIPSVEE